MGLVAACCVVTVAACSGDASPERTTDTASSTSDGVRDVSRWQPSVSYSARDVTADEQDQSRQSQVNNVLTAGGLEPDSFAMPDLVRWVHPDESAKIWAQCVTDKGFPSHEEAGLVVSGKGFGDDSGVPEDQRASYQRAVAECVGSYPIEAWYQRPWEADQYRIQYQYLTEFYLDCVASYGVSVNREGIPTEDRYVSEEGNYEALGWDPYSWMRDPANSALASASSEEGLELAENCRQIAPNTLLYGR